MILNNCPLEAVISYQLSDVGFQFTDYCLLRKPPTSHSQCSQREKVYFRPTLLTQKLHELFLSKKSDSQQPSFFVP
ncbi:MAG: hypothetical protein EWV85_00610 [Microcystis aeruginosa Ma_QC_C_20070703_M131]|uniref:Uncharacterized protein n=1 Tax=Microcystis aeruginosa Ma_QC_C_20070703_M131 TaxID=2486263 RepID=A0A551YNA3_MICAE|nr:MAG: hypothetical protein EWV85_00610 [Microcystis aeruginosa Ma_QC_C_20070703_M131]